MRFEFGHHRETDEDVMPQHLSDMIKHLAGGKEIPLSRPDQEEDEPAFSPEDFIQPTASIWARRNIPNN